MGSIDLKGKSFLTLLDFSPEEIAYMLDSAAEFKKLKKEGKSHRIHEGKNVALIFEKTSTRTRCAFEVAAADLGMHPVYLDSKGSQIGKKESIRDTAKVLGRMFDGIEYRGFGQERVEELAKESGVPVWNGLTDQFHPTQILATLLTIKEHFGKLKGIKLCFSFCQCIVCILQLALDVCKTLVGSLQILARLFEVRVPCIDDALYNTCVFRLQRLQDCFKVHRFIVLLSFIKLYESSRICALKIGRAHV